MRRDRRHLRAQPEPHRVAGPLRVAGSPGPDDGAGRVGVLDGAVRAQAQTPAVGGLELARLVAPPQAGRARRGAGVGVDPVVGVDPGTRADPAPRPSPPNKRWPKPAAPSTHAPLTCRGLLYILNTIDDKELIKRSFKRLIPNSVIFLFFFLM